MQELKVRESVTAGTLGMVLFMTFFVTFFTTRSDEPLRTFLAVTAICSVVLLVAAAVLGLLTRLK